VGQRGKGVCRVDGWERKTGSESVGGNESPECDMTVGIAGYSPTSCAQRYHILSCRARLVREWVS
jgi:hypothetical protein